MKAASILWLTIGAVAVGYFGLRDRDSVNGFFETQTQRDVADPADPGTSAQPNPPEAVTGQTIRSFAETAVQAPGAANLAPPSARSASSTLAQASRGQATPSPGASAAVPQGNPAVDETALRYFARRGDTRRLEAEIARLRTLYPDWTPPADPLAVVPVGDPKLDAMWKLYSDGRYAELRRAIADRVSTERSWQPPKDLLQRLAIAEARDRLVNASNLKQYETVIRVAAASPSLLTCSEVDVLWRVAEAFAQTDRTGRSKDAYLYILKNCDAEAERVATVEKAIAFLPREAVEELLATERPGPDGQGEFAKPRLDLARRSVAAAGADLKISIPADDVGAVEAAGERDGTVSDARLLGWYYVGRENFAAAEKWFQKAKAAQDSAEISQGLALALIGLKRYAEAESVLYDWRNESEEVRKVYLAAVANLLAGDPPIMIEPTILQRMAPVVAETRDAAAAQQFGWYARALNQHQTAGQWFSTALTWKPDDEPSAYGLALTRWQLRDRAGVQEIQRLWAGRSERIATLGETRNRRARQNSIPIPPAGERGSSIASDINLAPDPTEKTAALGNTAEPVTASRGSVTPVERSYVTQRATTAERVERLPQRRSCSTNSTSNLGGEASLARGWCLMDLGRPLEAVEAFKAAFERGNSAVRKDAAWGQSLAYLRAGLVNEAAIAAAKAPQDSKRLVELEEALLSKHASDFFDAGRYTEALLALDQRARIAPERIDLMAMRGYAYLNLGRKEDARRVFRAIAATGSKEGLKGLNAVDPPKDNE